MHFVDALMARRIFIMYGLAQFGHSRGLFVLAKGGHPLTGTAAEVLDILTADQEEEPPPIR